MTDTANLGLPCIEGSQAQKHVTHNDALRILDTLVQLAVLDRDLTAPPAAPADGERWIVNAGATDLWAGHDNAIAAWQDGGWQFSTPQVGWCAFVVDEGTLLVWNGSAWADFFATVTSIQNLALLGIGTTADSSNPLSAKLNNALFAAKTVAESGSGDLRYKLSKESASNTLSFLLQDNYSGRAEIGLPGDDDFHIKVSPDGSTWYEALKIAAATGKVSFPVSGGPRELLGADRTYYVRTDGSDSNDGLSNTSGGAFLTIQKAINTVWSIDQGTHTVTIQVGAGTYTGAVSVSGPRPGSGTVQLQGDTTTPSNVVISTTSSAIGISNQAAISIGGFKLTTTVGHTINAILGASVTINSKMEYGSCGNTHINVQSAGVAIVADYIVSGGAQRHLAATQNGTIFCTGRSITLSGSPAFSIAFADGDLGGVLVANSMTFSGSASGARYTAYGNGVIYTNGGGASYFPGSSAGSTATGGQYI